MLHCSWNKGVHNRTKVNKFTSQDMLTPCLSSVYHQLKSSGPGKLMIIKRMMLMIRMSIMMMITTMMIMTMMMMTMTMMMSILIIRMMITMMMIRMRMRMKITS